MADNDNEIKCGGRTIAINDFEWSDRDEDGKIDKGEVSVGGQEANEQMYRCYVQYKQHIGKNDESNPTMHKGTEHKGTELTPFQKGAIAAKLGENITNTSIFTTTQRGFIGMGAKIAILGKNNNGETVFIESRGVHTRSRAGAIDNAIAEMKVEDIQSTPAKNSAPTFKGEDLSEVQKTKMRFMLQKQGLEGDVTVNTTCGQGSFGRTANIQVVGTKNGSPVALQWNGVGPSSSAFAIDQAIENSLQPQ